MTQVDDQIAVIGTGFSGLGMAIELRRSGREDFTVFERADSVGGTWRDNSYPGCACDVPTPLYSFSFAPNPGWSRLYAPYDEIRDYLEDCVDRFALRERIRFRSGVVSGEWDEDGQRWRLLLDDGSCRTARFVVAGIGGLNRPSFPEIEGLDDFAGPLMHSAAWDHDAELDGKRVAVIGTGASAIQLVPRLARRAAHLDVFQRTPPWVLPQVDFPMPGWARALFGAVPATQKALRALIWGIQEAAAVPLTLRPSLTRALEWRARASIDAAIDDPELRAAVTPDYKVGCKRILLSNDYYPALARENVDVVTEPIARVGAASIECADGSLREADAIVCATGFDIREAFQQVDVRGRGGETLGERWSERIEAHRGTMISGFPNLFMLSGPNTGTGNMSQVFMIEAQIRFARALIDRMERDGSVAVDVRREAQDTYNRRLVERMAPTVWLTGGCDSWYLTDEGHTGVLWPGFSTEFRRSLTRVREHEYEWSPPHPVSPEPLGDPAAA